MKPGWIGTGNMGVRMAERLVKSGRSLLVYNRTPDKAKRVLDAGNARLAKTPGEIAENCDVIFTSLTGEAALREILLGEGGVMSKASKGTTIIEMSTINPDFSECLQTTARRQGLLYLNAPVIGSMFMIEKGILQIIASGDRAAFDCSRELLEIIGMSAEYLGAGTEARSLKLAVNMIICSYLTLCGEVLLAGEAAGFSWDDLTDILYASGGASPMLTDKGTTIKERIWHSETALTSTALKDISLALECADRLNIKMPLTALVRQYDQLMNKSPKYNSYSSFGTIGFLEDICGITPLKNTRISDAAKKSRLSADLNTALISLADEMFTESLAFATASGVPEAEAVKYLVNCHGTCSYIKNKYQSTECFEAISSQERSDAVKELFSAAAQTPVFTPMLALIQQL